MKTPTLQTKFNIYSATETPLLPDLQGEEMGYNCLEITLQTQSDTVLSYCEAQGKEPADFMHAAFLQFLSHFTGEDQEPQADDSATSADAPLSLEGSFIDSGIIISATYQSNLYSEFLIRQLIESFDTLLGQLLNLQCPLNEADITSRTQLQLLDSFNQTDVPYDTTQTVVSLFRRQVVQTPDRVAVVYHDRSYTYRAVDEISERIAQHIIAAGLKSEEVVSILIPRSQWMVIASLGVLKAGCAYQPLDPSYPSERLNFMMKDANAKLLIADEALRILVDEYEGDVLLTKDISQLPEATAPIQADITPQSLFILLYTSGSTGVPKGCQLEHGNLVAFCHWYQRYYELTSECRVAAYASYGFDACMMDMYPALTCGACVYIIGDDIRLNLPELNDYFEANGISHSFITTQVGYQFAVNMENHTLKHLIVGGEKLSAIEPPTDYKMHNGYGPTECTIFTTNYLLRDYQIDIPIGKPLDNLRLYIVDKHFRRLPPGASGELWVSGPQVSRGYLNHPDKTAEVFLKNPFDDDPLHSRIYRTGDIVRYLPDGNIQFVGRKDSQVKVRGFRIELKEVEAIIREFPGIKDVTVQAFDETGGGKFLTAYIVSDQQVDIQALNEFIMEEKPPYMVPAVTMQIDSIPLNVNQKVDRKALPKPERESQEIPGQTEEEAAPLNVLEQELKSIVADIVGHEYFGLTTLLGYAGLTSITAIKLAIQINKRFGVILDSKALAKSGTLQSIENEVLTKLLMEEPASKDTEQEHHELVNIPLSHAQIGVYVDCIKQPTSIGYNLPMLLPFPKDTDAWLLRDALKTLVMAHPELRVNFGSMGSEIVQSINLEQPIDITMSRMSEEELGNYKRCFVRPFNLKKDPLYRFEIITTEEHVNLLFDIHHLVVDGSSINLLLHQLCDLMDGGELEPEDLNYADYVIQEKAAERGADYQAARDFFHGQLSECEGITEVPSDLTNPHGEGNTATEVCALNFAQMEDFCRQHNITPAHLTLAGVFYALSRFTNQERLCLCTISNGRSNLRISNTVGMFVNTLALSSQVTDQRVIDFLLQTSRNFDETIQHENYPFAQIAADYDLSPDIMYAYQMGVLDSYKCRGSEMMLETLQPESNNFLLAFFIREHEGKPSVCIEYEDGRYSQGLIQNLAQSVRNAINAFMRQPEGSLQQVSLLDEAQTQLLDSFNQTDVPYDTTQTVVSLFRRQVVQTPDRVAVVYHDRSYTYRAVDEISERIAQHIIAAGLKSEEVVSILIPRSQWMVIASLGVLKAGCAYQPLDPSYPSERLNFMMKDANAKLLIADEALRILVDEYEGDVLLTKDISQLPEATAPIQADITPQSLFILLYTSGSTGVPKGCQLEHGNLVAFCHWYQRYYELTSECRVAAYASYGFDACMMDMYPALTCGACVYIIGDDIRLNLPELNDYFEANGISHSFITTQVGYQFAVNMENHTLKHLIVGGEKLSAIEPPTDYKMHNGYGPTECTIFTTNYLLRDYQIDIPIGKPLDNLRLYIVDKHFRRLPPGASGELWVSGPQVSRGYLNHPDKTAEVFLKNPFDDDPLHSRIYRTGDIVRYLPDGNIQFIGRKDSQVKVRGFRIELKEVEAVIRQFPGIKDATVQAFEYGSGGKYIAAYIVSDEEVNIKELNTFIGKQKPPYMIPASTMQIEAIPLTQNQKVNRKALPTPIISAGDHAYVAPEGELEELFCKIFADILLMDKIGADDNFFELGGTSLMVTRVIIEADKNQHHIAYGDLFAHPTPRQLAAFISGNTESKEEDDVTAYDYAAIDELLSHNVLESFLQGERQQIGNVLLTGATGYLGIHVLHELIHSDVKTIFCLVRGANETAARQRLQTLLFYYFESNYQELIDSGRMRIVVGDVTNDIQQAIGNLADDAPIDTVFNCAAIVKHFSKGTEIEDINVGGAVRCVEFCLAVNARLIHTSTCSSAGLNIGHLPDNFVLTEQKLYFGQYLDNAYIHSKFLSERIVLEAIVQKGLSAKIVRLGNLAPRSTDGEFQINFQTNSAMGRVRAFKLLGGYCYADSDQPMEFSPINEVAKAVVLLSYTPRECCLFHPYNNHYVYFGDVMNELKIIGESPRQMEEEEFLRQLENTKNDPKKAPLLTGLLAYEDMAHGHKATEIQPTNTYTTQVLYRLGFHWSPTSWDYVDRFLIAINRLGYFKIK